MSPEVGPEAGGFYPEESTRRTIHEENFPRILAVMSKAGPEISALLSADHCSDQSYATPSPAEGEHTWIVTLFNRWVLFDGLQDDNFCFSGLTSASRGRLMLQFGDWEASDAASELTVKLGYYAGNQLDLEGTRSRKLDLQRFESSSALDSSNKPSTIRYENGTAAVSLLKD